MDKKKFAKKYLLIIPVVLLLGYFVFLFLWYRQQKISFEPQLSPQGQEILNQILEEMSH